MRQLFRNFPPRIVSRKCVRQSSAASTFAIAAANALADGILRRLPEASRHRFVDDDGGPSIGVIGAAEFARGERHRVGLGLELLEFADRAGAEQLRRAEERLTRLVCRTFHECGNSRYCRDPDSRKRWWQHRRDTRKNDVRQIGDSLCVHRGASDGAFGQSAAAASSMYRFDAHAAANDTASAQVIMNHIGASRCSIDELYICTRA